MDYDIWSSVCNSVLNKNCNLQKSYLQWYPFSKLNDDEKAYIKSEDFFNKLIRNSAIFKNELAFDFPKHYLQKTNGSFRNIRLVPPFIYLYIESIGYQVSKLYTRESNSVRCYYAGDMANSDLYYKNSYEKFFADINESSRHYSYYYKFDISNYFDSLNIDRLFEKINKEMVIIDLRTSLIYKRLIQSIGNGRYPIIENSSALSYLATYVYLDKFDSNLEEYMNLNESINDFQIIRYVDDLYIFFNLNEENPIKISSEIKNYVIHEYQQESLSINENKTKFGESKNVCEELSAALYDHYVNHHDIDISSLFDETIIKDFLDALTETSPSHNHIIFRDILDDHFNKEGIKYSSDEVFRYLIFYNKKLFLNQEIIHKLITLVETDYKAIKYNVRNFVRMILNTHNGVLIKNLLSKILIRNKLDAFDIAIILNYLLQRNFKHTDLINKVSESEPNLIKYIKLYCQDTFLFSMLKKQNNNIISLLVKNTYDYNNDLKVWNLYFMYKYYEKNNDTLESFAYYKTYFDRVTSLLMHYKNISHKKTKPDYNKYFKVGNTKKDFKELNSEYYKDNDVEKLLGEVYKLRNFNPINHSSAEIIDDTTLNDVEIKEIISKLEILLSDSFK